MNGHHSTPRAADGGSYKAIYDREWSSFVDSIITRWTPLPNSEDTATRRTRQTVVCLRDLMQLEEVLIKLKREGFTLSGDGSNESKKDHLVEVTGGETLPRRQVTYDAEQPVPRERQRKPLRTITARHLSAGNRSNILTNCSWEISSTQKPQLVKDKCDLITGTKTAIVGDEVQPSGGTGPSRNNSDDPLSPRVAVSHREPLVETFNIPDETNGESSSGLSGVTVLRRATEEKEDGSTSSSRRLDVGPLDGRRGGERGSRITPKIVEVVRGDEVSKGEADTSRTDCTAACSGMEQGIQKLELSAGGDNGHGSEMKSKPRRSSSVTQQSPDMAVAEGLYPVDKRSWKGGYTTSGEFDANVIAPHETSRGTGITHNALPLSSSRILAGEGLSCSTSSPRSDTNDDKSYDYVRGVDTGVRTPPNGNLPSAMEAEKCSVTPPISNGTGEQAKSPKAPSSPSPSSLSSTTPAETPKGGSLDATMLDNTHTDSYRLDSGIAACAKGMRNPLDQSRDIDRIDGDSEDDSGTYFSGALGDNDCTSLEVAQMACSSASRVISEHEDPQAMPGIHETSKDQTSAGGDVTRVDPDIDRSRVIDEGVGYALVETADPYIVGFAGSSAAGHDLKTETGPGVVLDSWSHRNDACGFADEISTESPEMIRSYLGYHASSKGAANIGARTKFGFGEEPVVQLGVKQDTPRGGEGITVGDECHSPPAKIKGRGVPIADEMFESDGLSPGVLEFDFNGGEAVSPITLSSLEDEGSYADNLRSLSGNVSLARSSSDSTLATDASPSPDAAVPRTIGTIHSPYQVRSDTHMAIREDNGSTQYPGTSSQETGEGHSRPADPVQGSESDAGTQGYTLPHSPRGAVPRESEHDAKSSQNFPLLETPEKEHESIAGGPVVRNDTREWHRGRDSGSSSKSTPALECPCRGSRGMVTTAIDGGETSGHQKTSPLPRQTPFCPVVESLEEVEAGVGMRMKGNCSDSGRNSEVPYISSSSGGTSEASQVSEGKSPPHSHDDLDERWGDVRDISLLEGTPRRGGAGIDSGSVDLSGFYAPLSMTYRTKIHRDDTLSTEQSITLEWMLWREDRIRRDGTAGDTSVGAHDDADMVVNGGILSHLDWQGAMGCVVALIQKGGGGGAGKRSRSGELEASTGLPKGATLIVSPSRQAAREWSDQVAACSAGLSVLEYMMPLRERRRLSARQVAAFDVVVTTYDILRAREVPQTGAEQAFSSESNGCVARNGRGKGDRGDKNGKDGKSEWLSRRVPKEVLETRCRDSQAKMTSTLQQVWWRRVVADGADILANRRSTRADTLLQLAGEVRWCVVARENMGFIENASERMRSLTHFLRIPSEIPLVEAAPYLFFNNRPPGIATKASDKCKLFPLPGYLGSWGEVGKGCFRSLPRTQSHTLDKEETSGRASPELWRSRGDSRHINDARGGRQPQLPKRNKNRTAPAAAPPGDAHTIRAEGLRESSAQGAPALGSTPITHITLKREKVTYSETRLRFRRV